ncbi:MAG: M48 family metallopeptidase [Myxococcota bacterium]
MSRLPPGRWFGHLTEAGPFGGATDTRLSLQQQRDVLTGTGDDLEGSVLLDGRVDDDGAVRWTWRREGGYLDGERTAFVGRWDAAAQQLEGRWRVADQARHGTFTLRPGEAADLVDDATVADVLRSATHQELVDVDLEAVRFDGERVMLDLLAADEAFVAAVRGGKAMEALGAGLGPRLPEIRLSPLTCPPVFEALARCRVALGLRGPVDLLVENNGQLNAFVDESADGRIRVTFTSALIDRLDVDEIAYILGHELGHVLLGHLRTQVASDATLSGVTQLRRLALSRYQELSADRLGLLCCGDPALAVRTEFVLHTGITRRDAVGEAAAIEAAAEVAVRDHPPEADGFDTHPAGAFRTLALAWFGRSAPFHALCGRTPPADALPEAELEARTTALVSALNPALMDAEACDAEIDELVALVGGAVADADRGTSRREAQALRSLSPGVAAALDRAADQPFEVRQLRAIDLADKLAVTLTRAARIRIVEDLTMIAQVDGHLADAERAVLDGLALVLQVPDGFADELLSELERGLD